MLLRFCSTCLIVMGCAGSAPPKSPEGGDDASPPEAAAEAKPSAESDTSEAPANKPSESSAPASNEDVQAVLQLVLDDDALGPYLHLDKPDRFPVRISGRDLPAGIEVTKATKPVVIVPEGETDKKPTIVFTEIKVEGDEASVRYRYDVEKVRGSSSLKRRDKQWVLVRSRVTEH